jgi:hypothetical protein
MAANSHPAINDHLNEETAETVREILKTGHQNRGGDQHQLSIKVLANWASWDQAHTGLQ